MSLKIRLNGNDYTDFLEASVFRSIETVSGAFNFTSTANVDNLFPLKVGDAVQVLADDQVIITGFIEKLDVDYTDNGHNITVSGRDVLGDLVDSTTSDIKEFDGGISLETVCRTILDSIALTGVKVINNAGTIKNFSNTDITSADVGKTAFEFLESYSRKRQVLITTDGLGNLILARASTEKAPVKLQNVLGSNENNIKSAKMSIDSSKRFNKYIVFSQLNPIGQDSGIKASDIVDQNGNVTDKEIRSTRIFELNAEESMDSESSVERAKWESNIRRARAFDYSCTVQGHTLGSFLWKPNVLVEIEDVFADVSSTLLIRAVENKLSIDGGNETVLSFAKPDAYTLQAVEDQRQASTSESGGGFLG